MSNLLKSWWLPFAGIFALVVIKFGIVQVLSFAGAIFIILWVIGFIFHDLIEELLRR